MKKKCLIFIEDGSFTFDNRVIREAKALNEAGWDITVISPKYPDDPFFRTFHGNLRAYYYPKPNAESIIGHLLESLVSFILGSGLTFFVFIRHGFSVFQACNPTDILWAIGWPYKTIGRKFIFDQHDLVPELILSRSPGSEGGPLHRVFLWLERCSYRLADAVIATNESYKQVALERGGKRPHEVFVVRNGPDLKKFRKVPPKSGIHNGRRILVGYLGNMNPQDGVGLLLQAAKEIVRERRRTDIGFVFVGGGPSQPSLVREAKSAGLEEYVSFTGRVPDGEMLSILNACDVCVQPDPLNPLNDKSTMNKVLEYMALEKPVVAFDLKETRVSCADAALYATPNEAADLAEKIVFLADRPEIRADMGRRGKERVEKALSWGYSVPHLVRAYQYVLNGKEND